MREVLRGSSSHDPDPMAIHSDLGPGEKNTDVLFHLAGRLDFKREVFFFELKGMWGGRSGLLKIPLAN